MANTKSSEIIDLLGGTAKTARRTQVKMPSVTKWRKNGIPKDKLIILAPDIEALSGGKYTRANLLPECCHLIWPELAEQKEA